MATKKLSDLTIVSNVAATDLVLLLTDPSGTPNAEMSSVTTFFSNVKSTATFSNTVTLEANTSTNNLHVTMSTPAGSTDVVLEGKIWFDENYIYCATSNNNIKRAALSSF